MTCTPTASGSTSPNAAPPHPGTPLVVLLHGFADFWWSWRHQLTALAAAGYRAVAVDLRGYGDTDKPPRGYDGWTLSGDVAGLIRALGHSEATLVGHADGGLVCWATAVLHPRLVDSIVLIASPHPIALKRAVLRDRAQRTAWLPAFLRNQPPWLPERHWTKRNGLAIEQNLLAHAGPAWSGAAEFSDAAARMRSAIQIPGAAHSALEYQRWWFRSQWRPDGHRFMTAMNRRVEQPAMQIHGDLDPYVLVGTLRRCTTWAPRRELVSIASAGHYVHQERPDDVTAEIVRFLGAT